MDMDIMHSTRFIRSDTTPQNIDIDIDIIDCIINRRSSTMQICFKCLTYSEQMPHQWVLDRANTTVV